jgi:hypothetical protein
MALLIFFQPRLAAEQQERGHVLKEDLSRSGKKLSTTRESMAALRERRTLSSFTLQGATSALERLLGEAGGLPLSEAEVSRLGGMLAREM